MFKKQHAPKTILIAEDDSSIGAMLLELIKSELPYPGVLVTDGLLALEVVSPIQPVLFLFNSWLPGMNGIQLYDHMHHMEGLEDVPTIMLSAALPHDELKERRIVGIEKPFDIDIVLQTVEALFPSHLP